MFGRGSVCEAEGVEAAGCDPEVSGCESRHAPQTLKLNSVVVGRVLRPSIEGNP